MRHLNGRFSALDALDVDANLILESVAENRFFFVTDEEA
jgi:hypothetical protein